MSLSGGIFNGTGTVKSDIRAVHSCMRVTRSSCVSKDRALACANSVTGPIAQSLIRFARSTAGNIGGAWCCSEAESASGSSCYLLIAVLDADTPAFFLFDPILELDALALLTRPEFWLGRVASRSRVSGISSGEPKSPIPSVNL